MTSIRLTPPPAFFKELGLELEGEAQVEGRSVDRLIGLDGVLSEWASVFRSVQRPGDDRRRHVAVIDDSGNFQLGRSR